MACVGHHKRSDGSKNRLAGPWWSEGASERLRPANDDLMIHPHPPAEQTQTVSGRHLASLL